MGKLRTLRREALMSLTGRKSPLGGHGWISSPERRETATFGRSSSLDVVI